MLQRTKDLDYTFYPPKAAAASAQASSPEEKKSPVKEKREFGGGSTPLELLRNIGTSLEKTTNLNGRGMLLVRDGELHIGPRPIPLQSDPKELRLSNGLIETEAAEPYKTDQNFNPCSDANVDTGPVSSSSKAPTRKQFKLTLKGRPDIKPGDVVVVDVPKEDAPQTPGGGLLGAIGDLVSSSPLLPSLGDGDFKYPAYLYVNSVEHVLGRASGFATTVYGIQIAEKKKPDPQAEESWDKFSALGQKKPDADPPHTSADMQAAHAVRNLAQDLVNGRVFPEVGEVRAMTPKSQGEDLSQTLKLDIGLAPGQGKLNEASRLAIQHPSLTSGSDIPYLTPFAWGKCGLVLPRYPGTRVLVNYHNGNPDDPIEAGSFWEAERGPDSELGDWWLILPVGASTGEPAEDKSPDEHNGPVTHDLMDAKGNRVIEVGELTIRIGDLKSMSEQPRPKRSDDEQAITLEHTAGSKIVMDKDGNITITAAKDITLDASNGTITMKAQDVKVKVDNAMDIS